MRYAIFDPVETLLLDCWAKNDALGCSINILLEIWIHLLSPATAENGLFQQPHPLSLTILPHPISCVTEISHQSRQLLSTRGAARIQPSFKKCGGIIAFDRANRSNRLLASGPDVQLEAAVHRMLGSKMRVCNLPFGDVPSL